MRDKHEIIQNQKAKEDLVKRPTPKTALQRWAHIIKLNVKHH